MWWVKPRKPYENAQLINLLGMEVGENSPLQIKDSSESQSHLYSQCTGESNWEMK